jgi:hypothetical protein
MKKIFLLLSINLITLSGIAQDVFLDQAIAEVASQLQASQRASKKLNLAVLHFRMSDEQLNNMGQYIQDELQRLFKQGTKFDLIDPLGVSALCKASGWNLAIRDNQKVYSALSESIFREFNEVPDAFLYGVISDNESYLTLNVYIVPNAGMIVKYSTTAKFLANEQSDKLLGKPITHVQKKNDPQVIYKTDTVIKIKEKVVDKRVTDTVFVEKKVYINSPDQAVPAKKVSSLKIVKVGDLTLELKKVEVVAQKLVFTFLVTNTKEDQKLYQVTARFFDDEGNEYDQQDNTLRYYNLIENISAKVTFSFEKNAYKASQIKVLEITIDGIGKVQLKDIVVE